MAVTYLSLSQIGYHAVENIFEKFVFFFCLYSFKILDAPIDLSMKSSSSTSNLSGLISTSPINDHRSDNDDANVSSEEDGNPEKQSISFRRKERPHSRSNSINTIGINDDGLRIKGTKPLDLTTKA